MAIPPPLRIWLRQDLARWTFGAAAMVLAMWGTSPAMAAETVLLRYRSLERAVPVADLATFSATGEPPDRLAGLLRASGQDAGELQRLLTEPVAADVVLLDRGLNSWPGEWLLDRFSGAIYPPRQGASRQALRAALVLSASDDGQLSLLEILETYPTPEVVVEVERVAAAYGYLQELTRLLDWIR